MRTKCIKIDYKINTKIHRLKLKKNDKDIKIKGEQKK